MTPKKPVPWSPGIRKVLAHMREKRGEWFLWGVAALGTKARAIRRLGPHDQMMCPLTSPRNLEQGKVYSLRTFSWEVVLVADGYVTSASDARLRAAMLRAAGLKEQR